MSEAKILYVDSQKDYSSTLLENLIDSNYDVKFSDNINDALISFSTNVPELIIIDSIVNNISVFKFLKKLKNENKDLKIIILTNENNQDIFLKAIDLQIDKLIFKNQPFEEIKNYITNIKILKLQYLLIKL